jgi:hypothetical protein
LSEEYNNLEVNGEIMNKLMNDLGVQISKWSSRKLMSMLVKGEKNEGGQEKEGMTTTKRVEKI